VPNIRWLLKLITIVHRFVYRASGGRIGARLLWMDMLLLTHTGRKSGRTYVTPLLYVRDGDRFLIAASNAGDDRAPAWWHNLKARPDTVLQAGRDHFSVRARQASGVEEQQLWKQLEDSYGPYRRYREKTNRRIPLIVLDCV
jgi:deazaflavin-dependent oxidoreductase (nitroreductase family)